MATTENGFPSFYFEKAGSAASWYLSTETELQALRDALASFVNPAKDTTPAMQQKTVDLPELEEGVSALGLSDMFRASPESTDSDPLQLVQKQHRRKHFVCQDSISSMSDIETDEPQPEPEASSDSNSTKTPQTAKRDSFDSWAYALVDIPEDDTLFMSPRPAPAPPRPGSRASTLSKTPSLPSLSGSYSSDSARDSIFSERSSGRSSPLSWSGRLSRSSIASVSTNRSARSSTSVCLSQISKPLPILPEDGPAFPTIPIVAITPPEPEPLPRRMSSLGLPLRSKSSLVSLRSAASNQSQTEITSLEPLPECLETGPQYRQVGIALR